MADKIRKAAYFYAMVPNRPGAGAKILRALRKAKVNLLAFSGFPEKGGAQLDFVPEDRAAFLKAARRAGVKVSVRKTGFLVTGDDRVGAVSRILEKLAAARINLIAMDAVTAGKGRFGALFWVRPADVAKAARALGAR